MTGFTVSKYVAVAQSLQQKILKGEYAVGEKLPTEKVLAEQNKVSVMTVRQGMELLVKQGLITRKHGLGSFVLKTSQAQANIALLFGDSLSVESAHYYRALASRFESEATDRKWNLRYYDKLNREMFSPAVCDRNEQKLIADHQHKPFSGVIEISPGNASIIPHEFMRELPHVIVESGHPDSAIKGDPVNFATKAVKSLMRTGSRNLFYFATPWKSHPLPAGVDAVMDMACQMGLPPVSIHVEYIHTQGYVMEQQLFRTFSKIIRSWKKPGKQAPDGIIFTDDIALRSVAPALLQAGYSVPRDLRVFCAGNEDVRFHYGFPIIRYEISPRHIAEQLLSILDRRMNGETGKIPPFKNKHKIVLDPSL